jgi:vancomycin resistance protein YoaR
MSKSSKAKQRKRSLKITAGIFACVLILSAGAAYVWAQNYQDRIAPNVFIGTIDVGGLDPETARQKVQSRIDSILTDGIVVKLNGSQETLPLSALVGSDMIEHATFDVDTAIAQASSIAHAENPVRDTALLLVNTQNPQTVGVPVQINREKIRASLKNLFPTGERERKNASFSFVQRNGKWSGSVQAGSPGRVFHLEPFEEKLRDNLTQLKPSPVRLKQTNEDPDIDQNEARQLLEQAEAILNKETKITLTDPENEERSWTISDLKLAKMLQPVRNDDGLYLSVGNKRLEEALKPAKDDLEQPAQNARFSINEGRVEEFVGSRPGVEIDIETTKQNIESALNNNETSIALATHTVKPEVTTDEVNDLGITEKLGVGTSSYAGSPANRISNIKNGVRLLNGLLIEPGETFSLNESLKPYNYENGYLPELVIKGDKIEPEIGGGLCQIGTTTFRATMNSGLPVEERRNHSLVVSYYNDPSNGNPGTDATIYDPAPDFKFKNNTGNYVLFQAESLDTEQKLRFTFWGTSDGREGYYTNPVVHNWIPHGPTKEVETTELEPGQRKCQEAHMGANASFTYIVEQPDGEADKRTFSSHYRPLPRICLVGVDEESDEADEGEGADASSGESKENGDTDGSDTDGQPESDSESVEQITEDTEVDQQPTDGDEDVADADAETSSEETS